MTDDEMGELTRLRALARSVRAYLKTFDESDALDMLDPAFSFKNVAAAAEACGERMEEMRAALARAEEVRDGA